MAAWWCSRPATMRDRTSSLAALPSQLGVAGAPTDLERGWLVATAVDPYAPGTLASANACGRRRAIAWRRRAARSIPMPMAAPTLELRDVLRRPVDLRRRRAGLAALPVLRQQPGAADPAGHGQDIGAPGVDAVFGYGLLDISRAIKGPGRFDWGDVVANVDAPSSGSLWSNDIVGSGGLVKQGGAPWCSQATTATAAPPASNAASCRCRTAVSSVPT